MDGNPERMHKCVVCGKEFKKEDVIEEAYKTKSVEMRNMFQKKNKDNF